MYAFEKRVMKADRTRRYSIQATAAGWEAREEQDSETVWLACYQDWHRVERARLSFVLKLEGLRLDGWQDT
jgi:hypothetical protein